MRLWSWKESKGVSPKKKIDLTNEYLVLMNYVRRNPMKYLYKERYEEKFGKYNFHHLAKQSLIFPPPVPMIPITYIYICRQ